MAMKNCAHCGTPFQIRPQGKHAKFCSTACRVANNKQLRLDKSTLTMRFGNITLKILDLSPAFDKESLRQKIIDTLGPELIEQAVAFEPPLQEEQERVVDPVYEKRIPVQIIYEDGWMQQTNIEHYELAEIVGSQRLVGSTVRTVKSVN